jgi:hypothetical protein
LIKKSTRLVQVFLVSYATMIYAFPCATYIHAVAQCAFFWSTGTVNIWISTASVMQLP